MKSPLAILLLQLVAGVVLFIAGAVWGAVMVGAAPKDLTASLGSGGVHTWIATILMSLGTGFFLSAPLVSALVWLRRKRVSRERGGTS